MLGQQSGVSITGHDQLSAVFNDLNDCVQEFLLSGPLVVEEFNIVNQQYVDIAKSLAE